MLRGKIIRCLNGIELWDVVEWREMNGMMYFVGNEFKGKSKLENEWNII